MAYSIKGNDITLVRGDTFKCKIKIYDREGLLYVPEAGDKIKFAMKNSFNDIKTKLEKEIPYDTMELRLDPKDTKWLPQPSSYVYEICLIMNDGTVDTFLQGKINIAQEVN